MDFLDGWQIWLIATFLLLCCEILDGSFVMTCFAIGALFGSVVAICGAGLVWQLVGFAIGALIAFLCVRPLAVKYLHGKNKKEQQMQMDVMAGREAVVVEQITATSGRVAIDGTDWKAQSAEGVEVAVGEKVCIIERKGNTLIITK